MPGEIKQEIVSKDAKKFLPNLLQNYIGGFFKVYYNITDLVGILKGFDHFQYYICSAKRTHFVSNLEKILEYVILGKYP